MSNRYGETKADAIAGAKSDIITSGSGTPSSTPDFVGQRYIDTTGNREYYAVGTSSSADWRKVAVFRSGTETVTGGGGDVTVNLDFDWTDGRLSVIKSNATTDWVNNADTELQEFITSYEALTNASYTSAHMRAPRRSNAGAAENIGQVKTANQAGQPKSATSTSFTLDDDGATTVYVKWFIIA